VDNTWDWPNPPGSTPIPVSDVQYNAISSSNNAFPIPNILTFFISTSQALDALGITNPAARQNWINGYLVAGNRESSYNTGAVNTTDKNAVGPPQSDGAPAGSSRGIMQVTPTDFAEYHQPGTSNNVYDPVANIAGSMNYVMKHYGVNQDGSNLLNVSQFNPNLPSHGYS
jgi:SLT domain-containing protein